MWETKEVVLSSSSAYRLFQLNAQHIKRLSDCDRERNEKKQPRRLRKRRGDIHLEEKERENVEVWA